VGVSRYAMQPHVSEQRVGAAVGCGDTSSDEPVTLRFFRNPAPAPAFAARDLDGREISAASLAARSSSSTSGRPGARRAARRFRI
jgi:hypothetical protein